MSTTDSLFVNHLIIFDKISEREIPLVHASELYTTSTRKKINNNKSSTILDLDHTDLRGKSTEEGFSIPSGH